MDCLLIADWCTLSPDLLRIKDRELQRLRDGAHRTHGPPTTHQIASDKTYYRGHQSIPRHTVFQDHQMPTHQSHAVSDGHDYRHPRDHRGEPEDELVSLLSDQGAPTRQQYQHDFGEETLYESALPEEGDGTVLEPQSSQSFAQSTVQKARLEAVIHSKDISIEAKERELAELRVKLKAAEGNANILRVSFFFL